MITISHLPKFYQDNFDYVGEREVDCDLTTGMEMPVILIDDEGAEELVDLGYGVLEAEVIGDD